MKLVFLRNTIFSIVLLVASHSYADDRAESSDTIEQNKACNHVITDTDDKLLNFRNNTHATLCRTVKSIDNWFGDRYQFDSENFGGKLVFGFRQDEETGFDPKLRIRLSAKLPNASQKLNTFIGRTDDEAYIRDKKLSGIDGLANDLSNEDAKWLIGLGYRNPNKQGFDTSLGAKFSSGLKPYVKLRYRYFKEWERSAAGMTQTIFWEKEDGYGTTSNLIFDYNINNVYLATFAAEATILKDTEFWENAASTTLFKKLAPQTGIALRTYIKHQSGENSLVDVPEYGISIGYRKPFLKPWLILNTRLENRWVHDENDQPRESYAKLGMQLEMEFGKYNKDR